MRRVVSAWADTTTVSPSAPTAAPWQAHARRRGWAALDERPRAPRVGGSFDLRIGAGLTASEMCVMVEATKAGVTAAWDIDVADRGRVTEDGVDLSTDAWARLQAELSILEASGWTRYRPQALDGISWSMRWAAAGVTEAGGHNAYPPYGHGPDPSQEFVRLLLAAERLVGRSLWPGFDIRSALRDDHRRSRACRAPTAGGRQGVGREDRGRGDRSRSAHRT